MPKPPLMPRQHSKGSSVLNHQLCGHLYLRSRHLVRQCCEGEPKSVLVCLSARLQDGTMNQFQDKMLKKKIQCNQCHDFVAKTPSEGGIGRYYDRKPIGKSTFKWTKKQRNASLLTWDSKVKHSVHRRASVFSWSEPFSPDAPPIFPLQFSDSLESEGHIFSIIKVSTGLWGKRCSKET